jgi:phosphatidate cytidylyltransferase
MSSEVKPASSKLQTFYKRAFSTLLLWIIVSVGFFCMNPLAHIAMITILIVISAWEYFSISNKVGLNLPKIWAMTLSITYTLIGCWWLYTKKIELPSSFDIAFWFLAIAGTFTLQLRKPIDSINSLLSIAATVLGLAWIPWMFFFTARIDFCTPGAGILPGAYLLLWCVIVTKFTDLGAYITGTYIGRTKMIPHVSPGKTWEGFVGALIFAQIFGCGVYLLFPQHLTIFKGIHHVIILGFILALLSVVGDLAESLWKRALFVKDSGAILPGIGGALDLTDSICFTAPAVWLYISFVLQ